METFNKRLKVLIETLGFASSRKFDMEIGVPESQTACVTGPKQTTPKIDYLQKVKVRFPQVNVDWLICGEGDMLRAESNERSSKKINEEYLVQENALLKQRIQGLEFGLSLAANSANFQKNTMGVNFRFVSSKKPVNQRVGLILKIVADSIADRYYSASVIA